MAAVRELTVTSLPTTRRSYRGWIAMLCIIIILVSAWLAVRPGVFTIQPISSLPYGVTIIYSSRSAAMPFFSSPDSLCLASQGSVSLDCRITAFRKAGELSNNILLRLPYIRWAYLKSTGGVEFGQ